MSFSWHVEWIFNSFMLNDDSIFKIIQNIQIQNYAGESEDELELLEEELQLTLNLSDSLAARFIDRSLGENLLNSIFSMP